MDQKVLYSTSKDSDSKNFGLKDIANAIKEQTKNKAREEFLDITNKLQMDEENSPKKVILLPNFISFWLPKIKAFIYEGRDLINEENPNRSIFAAWTLEAGSPYKGVVIGIRKPGSEPTNPVQEKGNITYLIEVEEVAKTPGLSVIKKFNPDVLNSNLGLLAEDAMAIKDIYKLNRFSNDLSRDLNEKIKQEESHPDFLRDVEQLKNEWKAIIQDIEERFVTGKAEAKPNTQTTSVPKKENLQISDDCLDF